MTLLFQTFCDLLQQFAEGASEDEFLWLLIIQNLQKSLLYDESGAKRCLLLDSQCWLFLITVFWRDDKLRQVAPIIVDQIPSCIRLHSSEGKQVLPICLTSMMNLINADSLVKTINLNILINTRSEDVQLRIFALACSEQLWDTHGGKLLGEFNYWRSDQTLMFV